MSHRMLIVDDSPVMRRFIRRAIEISGLDVGDVLEASNGAEALELLKDQNVSAIVADLNMPIMDGEQFIRKLRQNDELRRIPVLVISTDSTSSRIYRLLGLGVSGYIRKPFAPEKIRAELEKALAGPAAANED